MCQTYLNIGGLIAMGFDRSNRYLLTVSHSGRGVYDISTWEKVAQEYEPAYPEAGKIAGIGPISGQEIDVIELDYDTEQLRILSPDDKFNLFYEEGTVTVTPTGT